MDELCEKLGLDPLEFRLLNGAKEETGSPTGRSTADRLPGNRAGRQAHRITRRRWQVRIAVAGGSGFWFNGGGKSSALASVNEDGTISLVEGSVDIGGSRTSISMQLAETLSIPVSDVKPLVGDTDSVAYTEGTYGSRTTFATGWAVYELGLKLKQQLIERAAEYWEIDPSEVTYAMASSRPATGA